MEDIELLTRDGAMRGVILYSILTGATVQHLQTPTRCLNLIVLHRGLF